jgi:plastocyanin
MLRRKTILFAGIATAMMTLAAACSSSSSSNSSSSSVGGGPSSPSESGKIAIGSDQANDHGTKDATGKSTFEIEADNDDEGFYFNPTVVTGSANQSLTLEIKNEGTAQHNFSIDSLGVNVTIAPGSSQEVKVTFPATGTVEFYCSFHRSLGMAGELQVT